MNILLANPRGFCAGVDRAIEIVERALELFGAPIYVRHEVVHNRFVVEDLKQKGAIFVEELDQIGHLVVGQSRPAPLDHFLARDDRSLAEGQAHLERRPPAGPGGHLDAAAVGIDDVLDQGQSQSGPTAAADPAWGRSASRRI